MASLKPRPTPGYYLAVENNSNPRMMIYRIPSPITKRTWYLWWITPHRNGRSLLSMGRLFYKHNTYDHPKLWYKNIVHKSFTSARITRDQFRVMLRVS